MAERQAYFYGVIRSPMPAAFSAPGMGERGDPVHAVPFGDLAAVVSASPAPSYASTRRNMMTHTRVLEEVMGRFAVLPARFGIVAPSVEEIARELIEPRRPALRQQLDALDGRIEMGLKAI